MNSSLCKFIALFVALAFMPGRSLTAAENGDKARLNVIFILIDDMGWMDTGCYGSKFYETPNIDKLASQGMLFTNAYAACPVCSPTRASILSGKYPARLNLTDWLPGQKDDPDHKLCHPTIIDHLPLEEITIPKVLKTGGYVSAAIGKWHLGGPEYYPDKNGFDLNRGGSEQGHPPTYFSPYHLKTLENGPIGEYLTDRLTSEAEQFIEKNRETPFFLYLSHYAVHNPQEAKKELIEKYKKKPKPKGASTPERENARRVQDRPIYAAMVHSADESVGRIVAKLEELKLSDRTIVIFTSDNGGLSTAEGSPTSNEPLRAGKGFLFEGGIREPLIVKWPGVVKEGSICDETVCSVDFYPTILDMAGLKPQPQQTLDGVSIVPLLKQSGVLTRDALFWHYPHYSNQGGKPGGAIRKGDFKLIEFYEDSHVELYNLKEDISEMKNLAGKMPEKTTELKKLLADWRVSVGAQMPTPNPDYKKKKSALNPKVQAGMDASD